MNDTSRIVAPRGVKRWMAGILLANGSSTFHRAASITTTLVLLAVAVVMLGASIQLGFGSLARPRPGLWPGLVSVGLGAFVLIHHRRRTRFLR